MRIQMEGHPSLEYFRPSVASKEEHWNILFSALDTLMESLFG